MKLTGLHILLTYQCTFECDHCFVWGSPRQKGTLSGEQLHDILGQAKAIPSMEWIYFEGGEPFLFYPILLQGVKEAAGLGFKVGIVSNAYWAINKQDAIQWLKPLAGLVERISVSSDLFHYDEQISQQATAAEQAAAGLGIQADMLTIEDAEEIKAGLGQIAEGESGVMYRGRAAVKLAPKAPQHDWSAFTSCPYEDLVEPGRLHLDPFGNLFICQGISLGNLFETPLGEICRAYNPAEHPIVGPLLAGGPVELSNRYQAAHQDHYADACHLCYETRHALRERFPQWLTPASMYGEY